MRRRGNLVSWLLLFIVSVECKFSLNPFSKVIENRRGFYQGYPLYNEKPPPPMAFNPSKASESSSSSAAEKEKSTKVVNERMDKQVNLKLPQFNSPPNYLTTATATFNEQQQQQQLWNPGTIVAPVFAPIYSYETSFYQPDNIIQRFDPPSYPGNEVSHEIEYFK